MEEIKTVKELKQLQEEATKELQTVSPEKYEEINRKYARLLKSAQHQIPHVEDKKAYGMAFNECKEAVESASKSAKTRIKALQILRDKVIVAVGEYIQNSGEYNPFPELITEGLTILEKLFPGQVEIVTGIDSLSILVGFSEHQPMLFMVANDNGSTNFSVESYARISLLPEELRQKVRDAIHDTSKNSRHHS